MIGLSGQYVESTNRRTFLTQISGFKASESIKQSQEHRLRVSDLGAIAALIGDGSKAPVPVETPLRSNSAHFGHGVAESVK